MEFRSVYDKESVEKIRGKIKAYAKSLPAEPKVDKKSAIQVKGKLINQFLGIIDAVSTLTSTPLNENTFSFVL